MRSTNPENITRMPNQNPIHCEILNALNSLKKIPPDTMAKKMKLHCSSGIMKRGLKILSAPLSRFSHTMAVNAQAINVTYVNHDENMFSAPLV